MFNIIRERNLLLRVNQHSSKTDGLARQLATRVLPLILASYWKKLESLGLVSRTRYKVSERSGSGLSNSRHNFIIALKVHQEQSQKA